MFQNAQSKNDSIKKQPLFSSSYCGTSVRFRPTKNQLFRISTKTSDWKPKPIVVFVHTSWCKHCKLMQNSSFKNHEVIGLLNENFYFVFPDSETREAIAFNQHAFQFQPKRTNTGIHELPTALATINNQSFVLQLLL